MNQYTIKLFQPQTNTLIDHPMPLDVQNTQCELQLRSLPGSSALYLLFLKDQQPELCIEVQLEDKQGEIVEVLVALQGNGEASRLNVNVPNHKIFTLPPVKYTPHIIPPPTKEQSHLDIAILIDGTTRYFTNTRSDSGKAVKIPWHGDLLLKTPKWQEYVKAIGQCVETLSTHYTDCRVTVMAFADDELPNASARDLQPIYTVYPQDPQDRRFHHYKPEKLTALLTQLEASSGGDIVDALAEGLEACNQLSWRTSARKLLILWGDSPGHALLKPPLTNMDIHVRGLDIDTAAAELHSKSVEILTVYQQPPAEFYEYYADFKESGKGRHILAYLAYTEKQYATLASLPEMALRVDQFAPETVATSFCQRTTPIAHQAAFGELQLQDNFQTVTAFSCNHV